MNLIPIFKSKSKKAIEVLNAHRNRIRIDSSIQIWMLECSEYSKKYFGKQNEYEKSIQYINSTETNHTVLSERAFDIISSMMAYISTSGLPKIEKNFLANVDGTLLITVISLTFPATFYFGQKFGESLKTKDDLRLERDYNELRDSISFVSANKITNYNSTQATKKDSTEYVKIGSFKK
jgi:hypothetical protein